MLFLLPLFLSFIESEGVAGNSLSTFLKLGVEVRFVYALSSQTNLACGITVNYLLLFSLLLCLGYVLTVRLCFNMLECLSNKEEVFKKHALVVLSCNYG